MCDFDPGTVEVDLGALGLVDYIGVRQHVQVERILGLSIFNRSDRRGAPFSRYGGFFAVFSSCPG